MLIEDQERLWGLALGDGGDLLISEGQARRAKLFWGLPGTLQLVARGVSAFGWTGPGRGYFENSALGGTRWSYGDIANPTQFWESGDFLGPAAPGEVMQTLAGSLNDADQGFFSSTFEGGNGGLVTWSPIAGFDVVLPAGAPSRVTPTSACSTPGSVHTVRSPFSSRPTTARVAASMQCSRAPSRTGSRLSSSTRTRYAA